MHLTSAHTRARPHWLHPLSPSFSPLLRHWPSLPQIRGLLWTWLHGSTIASPPSFLCWTLPQLDAPSATHGTRRAPCTFRRAAAIVPPLRRPSLPPTPRRRAHFYYRAPLRPTIAHHVRWTRLSPSLPSFYASSLASLPTRRLAPPPRLLPTPDRCMLPMLRRLE